ncbi:type VI secretion system tip protein VgrG [Mucilaginibacter celer]|uniref:Type VI secretion system tip protein VgrG n=1 Tax=Mucilaginibacter celer TaxID=2305508 RepID=A0A494W694_9SPHI|nr:type VI secretion system tip protein VgrG [Mucilaginibacter celer]AYL99035.1 type VI secretion system tip protein VgrG [Mucilaginibacter celer]
MATNNVGGLVTFTIKVNGSPIADALSVLSIHIEKKVNRISTARIVILDGEANTGKFDASSSATFVPGGTVSIEVGYDTKNSVVFTGIITGQSLRIDELVGSALEVECRDAAVKMIVGRKCLSFNQQTDSDIMSSIISTYSGLTANVTSTSATWPQQIQYYATDWDFILARAEANGFIVTTLNGTVAVFAPDANTTSVLTIAYGDGLMEFNADLNAINQLSDATASTWDYKTQAVITGQSACSYAGPGNLSSKTLSAVVGLSTYGLQTAGNIQSADLTGWTKAQLVKSSYSKIRGEAKFQGSSLVDPGTYITLQGLGDRFSGDHLVSAVSHDISDGNWLTEVSVGLSPNWFTEEPDVMAPPASGLLPGARGLISGTVKQMYEDPDSQLRILVSVPLFDANGAGIWARLSNFYSTSGAGAFFLPEVGDEVILGFLNEDPRYPVILGSVYSSSTIMPFSGLSPNEKNSMKAIVSKSGIAVKYDDENIVFTIATPATNTIIVSDKEKSITIQDQNQNSIVMSESGITIKSAKDINIQADQNVNITGNMGVKVTASSGDVAVSAMNIKENADMQYSAQGGEMAQVQGGMELTLKGAMVMIN